MSLTNKEIASSPSEQKKQHPAHELAARAVDAAADRKARDIVVLDLRSVSSVAEFFVLCTGDSELHIRAIVNAVDEQVQEACGEAPWHTEGADRRQWVVLDYVDTVVHVFNEEKRSFYGLERLWGDAPSEHVPPDGDASDVELLQRATQSN